MNPGHLLWILFGPGTWGTAGNLVASALLTVPTIVITHVRAHGQRQRHHEEKLAQAEEHHLKLMRVAADTYRHVTGEDHPVLTGE